MSNLQKTTDLWFASFLVLKGIDPIDYKLLSYNKGEYYFDISEEDWKKFKLEFQGSLESKIKYVQEQLKDLVH